MIFELSTGRPTESDKTLARALRVKTLSIDNISVDKPLVYTYTQYGTERVIVWRFIIILLSRFGSARAGRPVWAIHVPNDRLITDTFTIRRIFSYGK